MNTLEIDDVTPELKEYVRSKGGVISIGFFYQIYG
jgi:hypothetical protein